MFARSLEKFINKFKHIDNLCYNKIKLQACAHNSFYIQKI